MISFSDGSVILLWRFSEVGLGNGTRMNKSGDNTQSANEKMVMVLR